jgi:hypothetical protein
LGRDVRRRLLPDPKIGQHDLAETTSVGVARLCEQGPSTFRVEGRGEAVRVAGHRRRKQPARGGHGSSSHQGLRRPVPVDCVRDGTAVTGVVERRPPRVETEIPRASPRTSLHHRLAGGDGARERGEPLVDDVALAASPPFSGLLGRDALDRHLADVSARPVPGASGHNQEPAPVAVGEHEERVVEDVRRRVAGGNHDRAGVERRRARGGRFHKRAQPPRRNCRRFTHRERSADGALGVVLVRGGRSEKGQDAVASQLRHSAFEALHLLAHQAHDVIEEELRPLRAKPLGDGCRAGDVATSTETIRRSQLLTDMQELYETSVDDRPCEPIADAL